VQLGAGHAGAGANACRATPRTAVGQGGPRRNLFDASCVIAQRPAPGAVIHVPGHRVVKQLRVVARPAA
jgi:hypothetical protein